MKTEIPLEIAERYIGEIITMLRPHCTQIEPAGSVRRKVTMVGDLEIVAEPKILTNLFGEPLEDTHALMAPLKQLAADDILINRAKNNGLRAHYYMYKGLPLDLFMVTPPAQWGSIFMIRTGPKDYSHWLATRAGQVGLIQQKGSLWQRDRFGNLVQILTPTEKAYADHLKIDFMEPEKRKPPPEWIAR